MDVETGYKNHQKMMLDLHYDWLNTLNFIFSLPVIINTYLRSEMNVIDVTRVPCRNTTNWPMIVDLTFAYEHFFYFYLKNDMFVIFCLV